MRAIARVDSIQRAVTLELRRAGASVLVISQLGSGAPDIIAGYGGVNYLLELKSSPDAKLTPDEELFFDEWHGSAYIVSSPEQAIELVCHSVTESDR